MKRHIVKLGGGNTQLEKNKSKNSFPLCLVGMGKIPINLGDCPPEMLFTTATCNLLTFRFFVTFKCNFIEKEPSIAFQKVKQQGFEAGAGVFGWSRSHHFGPAQAPAPPYIFVN